MDLQVRFKRQINCDQEYLLNYLLSGQRRLRCRVEPALGRRRVTLSGVTSPVTWHPLIYSDRVKNSPTDGEQLIPAIVVCFS